MVSLILFLSRYVISTSVFLALNAQISDGRHLWVGEGGRSFSHYGWLTAVTVWCSKVSIQLLHCSGKFFICSWSKVKSVVFQVSTPDIEVNLGFGLLAWIISTLFLTSVLIRLGDLSLVPVSWDPQFISFRWAGCRQFDHYPTFSRSFLFLCWIYDFCVP